MQEHKRNAQTMTTQDRINAIKSEVTAAGNEWRRRLPWLRHNDAIGSAILLLSLSGMVASGWLYLAGAMAWWLCIPVTAFFASLTHELEHDLIHRMYFRGNALAHNLMMGLVWLARPSTINPWIRRNLHLNHHKHSGTATDIEERAITNGESWGPLRLLMVGDNIMSLILRVLRLRDRELRRRLMLRGFASYFPLGWLNWGSWYAFVGFHLIDGAARIAGTPIAWSVGTMSALGVIDAVVVVLVAPNVLRTFCLHFVSSNMHYYGDVEDGNVLQQTQVLNPWWLLPAQLFCFNFGSTHGIHHFVVKEPFYIRQLTAARAHKVMREMGVRFNDLGTFRRANRYGVDERASRESVKPGANTANA
ncbi:MAG: fatty acid desaturase [Gammaproteobacteria bacterium]|nr:fatty acid desaturase [Gammaproteobacteria bacterium]